MCRLLNILVYLYFLIVSSVFGQNEIKFQKCTSNSYLTIDITNGVKENATSNIIFENVTYTENDYFIENHENRSELQIFGCLCNIKKCVRKCCPLGQSFTNNKCQNTSFPLAVNFTVPVYDKTNEIIVDDNYFKFIYNKNCASEHFILKQINDDNYLQLDGQLYVPNNVKSVYVKLEHFCFDINENDNLTISTFGCDYTPNTAELFFLKFSIAALLISSIFLLVTFLVYACIPELRNIHGKCLMSYVLTLSLAFFVMVCTVYTTTFIQCIVIIYLFYFFFMTSFMWLNVMCIDIYWTFSGRRGFKDSFRGSDRTKFIIYCIYAWGVPIIMTCIALIIQYTPNLPDSIVKPRFGEENCWIPNGAPRTFYYYVPVLILIVSNLSLFSYTTFKVWTIQRDVAKGINQDSQRHVTENDKQRYLLYLRLMLIFGLYWLFELVPIIVPDQWLLTHITELLTNLYGVFIFIIFVCKKNIWKFIRKCSENLRQNQSAKTISIATLSTAVSSNSTCSSENKEVAASSSI